MIPLENLINSDALKGSVLFYKYFSSNCWYPLPNSRLKLLFPEWICYFFILSNEILLPGTWDDRPSFRQKITLQYSLTYAFWRCQEPNQFLADYLFNERTRNWKLTLIRIYIIVFFCIDAFSDLKSLRCWNRFNLLEEEIDFFETYICTCYSCFM